jgi:hypothetical protein
VFWHRVFLHIEARPAEVKGAWQWIDGRKNREMLLEFASNDCLESPIERENLPNGQD